MGDAFFKWLKETEAELKRDDLHTPFHNNFFTALEEYLSGFGYSQEKHKLTTVAIDTLRHVFNEYQRQFTPIFDPVGFDDVLRLIEANDPPGFWVRGKDDNKRYMPTDLLRAVLMDINLIYSIHPDNYYFEYILGQRRLCVLS
jgi:hypothetical protein